VLEKSFEGFSLPAALQNDFVTVIADKRIDTRMLFYHFKASFVSHGFRGGKKATDG